MKGGDGNRNVRYIVQFHGSEPTTIGVKKTTH